MAEALKEKTKESKDTKEKDSVRIADAENLTPNDYAFMNQYLANAMKKNVQQQSYLTSLSAVSVRNIRALKRLQLDTVEMEAEFHRLIYDLETKFQDKYDVIFAKRRDIINGLHVPLDGELLEPLPNSFDATVPEVKIMPSDNHKEGVPNFWINIFKFVPILQPLVKEADEDVLKYLTDVRAISKPLPDLSFLLEFHFAKNDYFTNEILTKEYLMKCNPDPLDPFAFDGPEIFESIGCVINWNEHKDLTKRILKKKQQDGRDVSPKVVKNESFFNFFEPPKIPDNPNDSQINRLLVADFEIGHYLKERVIPKAVLYFTGEIDDDVSSDSSSDSSLNEYYLNDQDEDAGNDGEGDN